MKNIKFIAIFTGLLLGNVAMAQVTVTSVAVRPDFNLDLKLGSRGEEVTLLQNFLSKMPNVYPEALVTGYYGKLTENAVKKFQRENNIEQVGKVGPKTRAILNSMINKTVAQPTVYEVPMVNALESSSSGATTGYVFYTTNKLTTSDLWYGVSSPLDSVTATKVSDSNKTFSHSHNLSGLATSTTYYYVVRVTDDRGNSATTTEKSFKTNPQ
jgi:peptidoglycan hydrolase-like protein with peptidoglycan-binding domain